MHVKLRLTVKEGASDLLAFFRGLSADALTDHLLFSNLDSSTTRPSNSPFTLLCSRRCEEVTPGRYRSVGFACQSSLPPDPASPDPYLLRASSVQDALRDHSLDPSTFLRSPP